MILKCFCCGKEIHPVTVCDTPLTYTPKNASAGMWDDAVVDTISANYGSKYDNSAYLIAICDDCFTERLDRTTFLYDYE